MLLGELIELARWLDHMEETLAPINKLNALNNRLQHNAQNRNQPAQSFTEQKTSAIEALRSIDLSQLSLDQLTCLDVHGGSKRMGPEAAEALAEVFRDSGNDYQHLVKVVNEYLSPISNARSTIRGAAESIKAYVKATEKTSDFSESPRFSIIFKGKEKIETLHDFEMRLKEWDQIFKLVALGIGVPWNQFKVLGARNGSIVIDIFLTAAAIVPVGFIVVRCLAILERLVVSAKKIKHAIDTDFDDPAFREIEREADGLMEKYFSLSKVMSAKQIAKDCLEMLGKKHEDKPEEDAHLQMAVKKILEHLKNGGDIDAYLPPPKDEPESENAGNPSPEQKQSELARTLMQDFRSKKEALPADLPKLLENMRFDEGASPEHPKS